MVEEMTLRIGIDFDNTIVDYRPVFRPAAIELGLLDAAFPSADKTVIRDHLRAQPGGELAWQQLQAHVYGHAIATAPAYAGLDRFLAVARDRGAMLAIVSHKGRFAAADPGGADLRAAAHAWLVARGIVDANSIAAADVYFEATRAEKVARVQSLALTHFIDDLEDVLADPAFPPQTRGVLFGDSWDAVHAHVFD
jgi:hypothetical protein